MEIISDWNFIQIFWAFKYIPCFNKWTQISYKKSEYKQDYSWIKILQRVKILWYYDPKWDLNLSKMKIILRFEVNKPSKILIKILNAAEYIKSNIQNIQAQKKWSYHLICMTKYTYRVHLKEFLKLFKCLFSSDIHTIDCWLDLLFKARHEEKKITYERIP